MIKTVVVQGHKVPGIAKRLTRKDGVMRNWLDKRRDAMTATLMYDGNRLVAWCAVVKVKFLWFYLNTVEVSTFVNRKMRGRGLAKRILNRMLKVASDFVIPGGTVRYGADDLYFNETYKRIIKKTRAYSR